MIYNFKRGTPAIIFEIFLPKKSGFQGTLYQMLTDGRDPEKLEHYLRFHAQDIGRMLRTDWPEAEAQFSRDFVADLASHIDDIFGGYSMYEVDGVFFAKGSLQPVEERVQVIRILFEYKIDDKAPDAMVHEVKRFLRAPSSMLRHYIPQDSDYTEDLRKVEHWVAQVGVFLVGFIMHSIVSAIEKNPELKQEQIWMTSYWNGVINKFLPPDPINNKGA